MAQGDDKTLTFVIAKSGLSSSAQPKALSSLSPVDPRVIEKVKGVGTEECRQL